MYSSIVTQAGMATKRNQLFKQKFEEYMGDDGFDDDISVGSGSAAAGGRGLGGLTGLRPTGRGLGSRGMGGLGGLGGMNKPQTLPAFKLPVAKPLAAEPPAAARAESENTFGLDGAFKDFTLEVGKIQTKNIEAMKGISTFLKELTEHVLEGFKEVSNRLNQQPRDEDSKMQESLDAMIKNIDEEIAAKDDVVYIIIPGHKTDTVTTDEAAELIKSKNVKIVGSISQLTF